MNSGAVQQVEYSKTKSQPTPRAADRPIGAIFHSRALPKGISAYSVTLAAAADVSG
jgi:hypothetical protein